MGAPRRTESHPHIPDPFHDSVLLGYFQSLNNWHGYIRLLGLPHLEDTIDEPLKNLFVEPYVHARHVRPEEPLSVWAHDRLHLLDVVVRHRRVVLLGDPGFGKSTLVSWITWNFTRWDGGPWVERLGPLVPIPLVVRELPITAQTTWDELLNLFVQHGVNRHESSNGVHLSPEHLRQLLANGQAIMLVDGLDEISQRDVRERLRVILNEGIAATPHCVWLITSRVVGYDEMAVDRVPVGPVNEANGPSAMPLVQPRSDMARVYCCPFDDEQIHRFAYAWFSLRDSRASMHEAEQTTRRFLDNLYAAAAPLTLARIPNLLTMFALVYRVLAEIPHGRSVLYARVADAYLDSIDKSRGFKPRFNPDRMERWLAFIAFHLQQQRSQVSRESGRDILIHRETIVELLSVTMKSIGSAPKADEAREFIDYVARRSGLLIPRGEDLFAFMHLSFQEYFAARFLQTRITAPGWDRGKNVFTGTSPDELREYTRQHVWRETLVLLFEMIEPEWATELLERLFLPLDCAPPPPAIDEIEERYNPWQLLTELVINPHTQFEDDKRLELLTPIVDFEVHEQQQQNQGPCCRLLLSTTGFAVTQRQQLFWAKLQASGTRWLDLEGCTDLLELSPVARLPQLEGLYLDDCVRLTNIGELASLAELRELSMTGCTNIVDLLPLSKLIKLEELSLTRCSKIIALWPLTGMTKLLWLSLRFCTSITDLTPLTTMQQLEIIDLVGCTSLTTLAPLANLPKLERVHCSPAGKQLVIPDAVLPKVRFIDILTEAD